MLKKSLTYIFELFSTELQAYTYIIYMVGGIYLFEIVDDVRLTLHLYGLCKLQAVIIDAYEEHSISKAQHGTTLRRTIEK